MFNRHKTDNSSTFWISYADLMAGLLFVFILLIGAIVSKSTILKTELEKINHSILEKEALLAKKNSLIDNKNKKISQATQALEDEKIRLAQKKQLLSKNDRLLKLKIEEIKHLNALLLKEKTKSTALNDKIVIVQTLLNTKTKALSDEKKTLKTYQGKVLVLSNQLTDSKHTVKLKDEKLLTLLSAMDEKKTKYEALVAKLQAQKVKIKSLTGIKVQVIAALKKTLGSKINIDKKTGSLKLASNILFDVGQFQLKEEAKKELKESFENYIGTLVSNKEIKPHLKQIIIEGHTDSDGGYIYNLKLSQNRALSVMEYLLTLDFSKKYNIKPLIVASGRSYLDAIKLKNGKENKEASRRIEIKFRLKNDDAMHEIEKVLDAP